MRVWYVSIATFILLTITSGTAFAQSGTVHGRVVDQTGAALPGVAVELASGEGLRTTVTDGAGAFHFEKAASGPSTLTFRLINFTVQRRSVIVAPRELTVDAVLTLALNADIVVTAPTTFRNVADAADPAVDLIGIAASSSQGAITAAQLQARPLMRTGEVLEAVPGMIVSQHSGEGKANQYYLRGFNLDHGTDFSTTIAGIPVNTPTGAHAHGYADASFLIPELVSGVQYKKGPYFADEGDFSAAGAANINYVSTLDRPLAVLTSGQDGFARILAAASPKVGAGVGLAAVELNQNDGPWTQPDDYRKANTVLRFSKGDTLNGLSVTGMGYWASWNSTDQVPERAIHDGLIPRYGAIDSTDGGNADRESLSVEYQHSSGPSSWRAGGFVLRNALNLFSNFTYALDDPTHGDQFEQAERRYTVGSRVAYRRLGHIWGRHTESAAGVQVRSDWLSPVGLYRTDARRRLTTTREDDIAQSMTGVFAQTEIEWSRHVRSTFGMRTDIYQFSATSSDPRNSGSGASALVSPKFASVIGPWAGTEFYINAGAGFHSNDARGAVRVDPSTGEPVTPVTPLVRGTGAEVGVRTVRVKGLQSTLTAWYLDLDSELLFVGDAGTTEAGRPSRRVGVEATNYWRINPWLTVDGDLAFTKARFTDDDQAGRDIPGSLDRVLSAGLTVEPTRRIFGSVRLRHFGPRPLVEDGSVMSHPTTLWNAEGGVRISPRVRATVELFNIANAAVSDIDYFYRSRLPGEPAAGIEDVHTHPALPRTVRVSLHLGL